MKKLNPPILFLVGVFLLMNVSADADEARLTRVTKEVKLSRAGTAPRIALPNESISNGTTVQTGPGAQGELRFDDRALVRLGQNSIVTLQDGARRMELVRGAVLVRVGKGDDAQLTTGSAVSVVGGTTSLIEYYPGAYTKLISLEGTARMFMPRVVGESVLVNAGQLLMFHTNPNPSGLPNPVDIDIKRLLATSLLIKGFAPLGSESSIAQEAQDQRKQKSKGALADTNLVIFGRGTLVSLVPPTPDEKPASTPTPTPARKRR